MGWANCGTDTQGRQIGYAHNATCDHPGCSTEIHRGLAYKCGPMHGEGVWYCEGYFCEKHRQNCLPCDDRSVQVCDACYSSAREYALKDEYGDAAELIAHFEDWEGPDWRHPAPVGTRKGEG